MSHRTPEASPLAGEASSAAATVAAAAAAPFLFVLFCCFFLSFSILSLACSLACCGDAPSSFPFPFSITSSFPKRPCATTSAAAAAESSAAAALEEAADGVAAVMRRATTPSAARVEGRASAMTTLPTALLLDRSLVLRSASIADGGAR